MAASSNAQLALTMLQDENKNLERALTVLQCGDTDSRKRIQELLAENTTLRNELRKERETNDVLMKYIKRQDRYIAYLKETRIMNDKKTNKPIGVHMDLTRKRSSSFH